MFLSNNLPKLAAVPHAKGEGRGGPQGRGKVSTGERLRLDLKLREKEGRMFPWEKG